MLVERNIFSKEVGRGLGLCYKELTGNKSTAKNIVEVTFATSEYHTLPASIDVTTPHARQAGCLCYPADALSYAE